MKTNDERVTSVANYIAKGLSAFVKFCICDSKYLFQL